MTDVVTERAQDANKDSILTKVRHSSPKLFVYPRVHSLNAGVSDTLGVSTSAPH